MIGFNIWFLSVYFPRILVGRAQDSSPIDVINRAQNAFKEFGDVVLTPQLHSVVALVSQQLLFPSVDIGKALGLRNGICEASKAGLVPLIVESDSQEVLHFIYDTS
ncbi:hypothetical protein NE237_028687 [Protea cynaroides]|uniref:RNase H type-1 domain-containing protein n=1 Tax=Protea cynaroides TaxID=273540 RepID=A0A9Q0GQT8_9MAGN|nr:hypothetical protein NE237_028687 [Protea cynaroides]